jgi:hypothetical protein
MVSPQKIKYNGIFSDIGFGTLDIILDVAFDSDNGAMSSYLNRSAVASESHDGRYKNTTRYRYDELFSPQFTMVKKDFSDFSQEEVRQVLKYLTSTDRPALLEVYYDGASNIVDWACIGGFVNIEMYKIANSRTVGIVAQFEAITPYAMSDLYSVTKTITASDNKITINIDTDDNKPVCPRVIIQTNGNDIKFINKHTDFFNVSKSYNSLELTNNASDETVTVDGANQIIKTSLIKRIFGDNFNRVWLELYDGKNELTINGNCTVTLEYRESRKIGEY